MKFDGLLNIFKAQLISFLLSVRRDSVTCPSEDEYLQMVSNSKSFQVVDNNIIIIRNWRIASISSEINAGMWNSHQL